MTFEIPSKLSKTLTGKIQVNYGCPNCGLELNNSLDEAGNKDTCPGCSASFVVPGEAKRSELGKQQVQQQVKDEEKQRQKVAQQIEHVEQSRKKQIELQQHQQLLAEQKRLADEKANEELRKLHFGYVYHVADFYPTVNGSEKKLTDLLNHFAAQGWEYVGFEIMHIYDPPGCLAGLLGQSGRHLVYHLVTFKKPLPK